MSSSDHELQDMEPHSVPGGSWSERKASNRKIINALFRKQFLIKFRSISAVLEWIVAVLMCIVLFPIDFISEVKYEELRNPPIENSTSMPGTLLAFLAFSNNSRIAMMPHTPRVQNFANELNRYIKMLKMTYEIEWATSYDDLLSRTEGTDQNGLGIYWKNAEDEDACTNPDIEILCQTIVLACPDNEVFQMMRSVVASCVNESNATDFNGQLANLESTSQRYPRLESRIQFDLQFVYSFFTVLPAVIATMPDFGSILDEKDSHIAQFAFLNGCPESAYWLVMFVTPFVLAFWPYLFICLMLCFWFRMVGCDFSLMLVISILYVSSNILFQMWITTFLKKGSYGRSYVIVMLVLALFLAFIHKLVTLDDPNSNTAAKHILGIIPISCYEMVMGSYYYNAVEDKIPIGWGNMNEPSLRCPIWIGLLWMAIDNVLYLLLFVICNACNPRLFGTPIIRWSELCKPSAWKRVFKKRVYEGKVGSTTTELIKVRGLRKVYHGKKETEVFKSVDFDIQEGEVIVIIGPNGAGKSTLVNILAGAIEPTAGTLEFMGQKPVKRFNVIQDTLGVVFQENIIFEKLSVREHLELFGAFKGISDANLGEAIDFFAETLQLTHMLDNFAGDLSGGQKRKLCIAISLLGNPPIVIMDEPTAGVDVQARQLIWKTIASLTNTTSIITSHALEEAETVSSRLFIVADQDIPFCGTSTELREEYQCGYLLRVEREDGTVGPVLDLAQSMIPASHMSDEREDTVRIPVDPAVPTLLRQIVARKDELGIKSYSFTVEQLEDLVLKLIETGENLGRRMSEARSRRQSEVDPKTIARGADKPGTPGAVDELSDGGSPKNSSGAPPNVVVAQDYSDESSSKEKSAKEPSSKKESAKEEPSSKKESVKEQPNTKEESTRDETSTKEESTREETSTKEESTREETSTKEETTTEDQTQETSETSQSSSDSSSSDGDTTTTD